MQHFAMLVKMIYFLEYNLAFFIKEYDSFKNYNSFKHLQTYKACTHQSLYTFPFQLEIFFNKV